MAQQEQGPSGINRRPIIFLFLLLCVLFVISYTGRMGQLVVLNGEIGAQQLQLEETRQRQAALEDEYAYTQTEQYTDEVARSEFGMSQSGDDLIVPVGSAAAVAAATRRPRPSAATAVRRPGSSGGRSSPRAACKEGGGQREFGGSGGNSRIQPLRRSAFICPIRLNPRSIVFHLPRNLTRRGRRAIVVTLMRGRAVVARRAHNPEVVGSNPAPAT